jgi:hypothetical protein
MTKTEIRSNLDWLAIPTKTFPVATNCKEKSFRPETIKNAGNRDRFDAVLL